MSQANPTGMSDAREKLVSADPPSYELLALESSDPDLTPTRLDIDARALDRALASRPPSEEVELEEIEFEDILEAASADPDPPPSERLLAPPSSRLTPSLPPPQARHASSLPPPPVKHLSSLPVPPAKHASPLPPPPARFASSLPPPPMVLLPPSRALLTSIDLVLDEPAKEPFFASSSFAPVSVGERSPWLSDETFLVSSAPGSGGRRRGTAWAVGLGLFAGVAVLSIALLPTGGKEGASSSAASGPEKTIVVATSPAPTLRAATGNAEPQLLSAPAVDVTSLPRAPVGTVSLAASASSHRLFVDGVVAPSGSVIVKCGKHVVRVGSRGRRQVVDVACGGETVVAQ